MMNSGRPAFGEKRPLPVAQQAVVILATIKDGEHGDGFRGDGIGDRHPAAEEGQAQPAPNIVTGDASQRRLAKSFAPFD